MPKLDLRLIMLLLGTDLIVDVLESKPIRELIDLIKDKSIVKKYNFEKVYDINHFVFYWQHCLPVFEVHSYHQFDLLLTDALHHLID